MLRDSSFAYQTHSYGSAARSNHPARAPSPGSGPPPSGRPLHGRPRSGRCPLRVRVPQGRCEVRVVRLRPPRCRPRRGQRRGGVAEGAADVEGQVGVVQRVDVQVVDALGDQPVALLAGDRHRQDVGRPRASRRGRRPCASTPAPRPCSAPAKFTILAKFSTGRMPGRIGAVIPAAAQASRKRRKILVVEEELGDRHGRAGVELALEVVDVGAGARRLGVHLGIGADRDLEVADPAQRRRPARRRWRSRRGAARSGSRPWAGRRAAPRSAARPSGRSRAPPPASPRGWRRRR